MKQLLVIFSLLFYCLSFGQTPSYFMIGEEEFAGIDIYDLHQDDELNYWIATSDGIYKFDSYSFKKIPCENMTSSSVFNIKSDQNGDIFCNNLSGQIFKIEDDQGDVFFQIPDTLMYHDIAFNFDDQNNLVLLTNLVFSVDQQGQISYLLESAKTYYTGDLFRLPDGALAVVEALSGRYYHIKNNEAVLQTTFPVDSYLRLFSLNNKTYGYHLKKPAIYDLQDNSFKMLKSFDDKMRRFYSDGENLWEVELSGGAKILDEQFKEKYGNEPSFKSHIISALMRDREGNVIAGTFDNGLIVVPNMNVSTVKFDMESQKPTQIEVSNNGDLYVRTQNGEVYKVDPQGQKELVIKIGNKHIESMAYAKESNTMIIDNAQVLLLNLNSNKKIYQRIGALKDVSQGFDGRYFLSTNLGVNQLFFRGNDAEVEFNLDLNGRTNAIGFNPEAGSIYAGSASGLVIKLLDKDIEHFDLNGKPILSRDILFDQSRIYVCTQNNGVLVFENDKHVDSWNLESGLVSNQARQILPYQGDYILSTDKGIIRLDVDGKVKRIIRSVEGLTSLVPNDICIFEDQLYVLHNKGIQKINLKLLGDEPAAPELKLNQVWVNDSTSIESNQNLTYTQDKLKFVFSLKTLKYKEELSYEYKLSGIDNAWQSNVYEENEVEYKSLPPGDYTFQYRVDFRGYKSGEQQFKFSISAPFWTRWWFYAIILVIALVIGYLVYRYQLNVQRKKAEFQRELIGSKLTAIQSQMNPHFIFNSLNSIQDLVLMQDGKKAYDYISKFAYLVRKVLHFSDAELIDIEDELKVLEVYLELEELRFSKDFEFAVEHDEMEGIQIPPMIVQPFVENAIKHGLLHRKGQKKLHVKFSFKDDVLSCTITDNGIGREKSAAINVRKKQQHESFSVKSIRSRFDILKSKYGGELGVTFHDLYDKSEAIGTKVVLKIPYEKKY